MRFAVGRSMCSGHLRNPAGQKSCSTWSSRTSLTAHGLQMSLRIKRAYAGGARHTLGFAALQGDASHGARQSLSQRLPCARVRSEHVLVRGCAHARVLFLPTKLNRKRRLSREIDSFSAKLTCSNHHGSDNSACVNIFFFIKASREVPPARLAHTRGVC